MSKYSGKDRETKAYRAEMRRKSRDLTLARREVRRMKYAGTETTLARAA